MAKIYIETGKEIVAGKSLELLVKLDTQGQVIAAIDGELQLQGFAKTVTQIHTGGSAFSLWPNRPSLTDDNLSFVGGIPGGVSGSDILLMTVVASPQSTFDSSIIFKKVTAYLSDSLASEVSVFGASVKLSDIKTNSALDMQQISQDKTPPNPFSIELGRDSSMFDGKYFISFFATDDVSGIGRYEVKEGDRDWIRSGSPYMLQDQSSIKNISVRAIDNAGNATVSNLDTESPINWLPVLIVVLLAVLLRAILKHK